MNPPAEISLDDFVLGQLPTAEMEENNTTPEKVITAYINAGKYEPLVKLVEKSYEETIGLYESDIQSLSRGVPSLTLSIEKRCLRRECRYVMENGLKLLATLYAKTKDERCLVRSLSLFRRFSRASGGDEYLTFYNLAAWVERIILPLTDNHEIAVRLVAEIYASQASKTGDRSFLDSAKKLAHNHPRILRYLVRK